MEETSVASIVGRGTAWLAISTVLIKIVGFFSIFVILNHLTMYEYGFAELVITTVPLFSLFLLPGLNVTVIADMGIERGRGNLPRMKGLLLSFFRLQLLFAVVIFAIVFIGGDMLAVWYGKEDAALLFKIISFSFLVSPMRTTAHVLQSVYFRFNQQSMQTMLEEIWKLLLLMFFFYVFNMTAAGLILAIVLSQLFALFSIVGSMSRIDPLLWKMRAVHYSTFHFLWHHGKWGIFSSYLGTVGKNIRPWIIKFFLGTEAVAIFAVVQGLIGHTVSLVPLDSIVKPMFPQYIHMKGRFYRIIAKSVKYELLGYIVVSVVAAISSPFFIAWFFPQYVPAVPLFQVMLIMLISTAFDAIFTGVFYALQAQRNLFFASVYKLFLTILIMPPLLYFFGLFGIIYASIVVNYLYVWERYLTLKRLMPGFELTWQSFVIIDEYDRLIIRQFLRFIVRTFSSVRVSSKTP
jgi:O-antigen/teichoic acid export membrane protein